MCAEGGLYPLPNIMKIFPKNPFLSSTGRVRRFGMFLSLACAFSAGTSNAATFNWNTTTGTWDTTTANWTGGGSTWVDSSTSDPVFANTATASTITLNADRTARTITIGNATNSYNYNLTGSSITLSGTTLAFAGSGSNNSQDHLASQTVFNGSLNLALSGNVTIRRGNLEFSGTGTYNVGNITTSGDWGIFRMSGSAIVNTPGLLMGSGGGGAVTGSFDLNGGTLTTGSITAIGTGDSNGNTWSTRNTINGATIKASQSNASFLTVSASSLGVVNGTNSGNNVWLGNNGVTFNSNGFNIGTATVFRDDTSAVGTLTKTGNGTLSLSGASLHTGATNVQGGTLRITGSLAAGSLVSVSGGAALGGTGTINGPVSLAVGSTAGTRGAIDLTDSELGTLTLANSAGLTLGGTAGNLSSLKFDVGTYASDLLTLGTNTLTVSSGGASITVNGVGVVAGNTYDLVSFGSGAGAGFSMGSGTTVGALTLANPNITFGVSGSLNVTEDKVQLVTTGAFAPSAAYWSGVKGSTWASNDGTSGNFTTNANGTDFVGAYPSSTTDVIFAANGNGAPTNLSNTLGQDFAINSLTFASGTAAVTISGANKLTLDGGINIESGNGGATLAMTTLALGNYQTWTNASNNNLTVSAAVTGTSGLSIENTGAGATILSGVNTYSGGTTLVNGTLRMSGSGTLGATNGSFSITAGVLDLNGTSQTIGQIDGTDGSILNNSSATNVTFSMGGGTFGGVIADHTSGTGTIAVTKTGNDVLTLSGANSYTGKTTLNGGSLIIGSGENIPNSSVLEINNGGKFNIQGFTETIGGLSSTSSDINVVQNQEGGGTGAGTLIIDTAGQDYTFTGIIRDNYSSTGTLALVKNGAGTQTLKSTTGYNGPGTFNDFTGGLTINGGTLLLSDAGNGKLINKLASDPVLTSTTATLALETTLSGNTQTLGKVISGSGNVVVTAANLGTVVLSQTNTYTGNTTVLGGTLQLATPSLSDTGAVSVAAGAVLDLSHGSTDTVGGLTLAGVLQPDGVYDATNSGGLITGTGKIQVGSGGSFAAWSIANAGGQSADLDFDNDGVANGIEYFMGETGSTFTANPSIINGKITWPKSPSFLGSYSVQTSPDLINWTDAASTVVGNNVEYTVPQNQGRIFIRLRVIPN